MPDDAPLGVSLLVTGDRVMDKSPEQRRLVEDVALLSRECLDFLLEAREMSPRSGRAGPGSERTDASIRPA